jgi:hypothetical protein
MERVEIIIYQTPDGSTDLDIRLNYDFNMINVKRYDKRRI